MGVFRISSQLSSTGGTAVTASGKTIETLSDDAFKAELSTTIPHLRAYGRSLCGNPDTADDLVQETMLRAWKARKRYEAGTNMRAWCFIILRNLFLSQIRRNKFTREWDDAVADKILAAPAEQEGSIHLADVQRALLQLPEKQREALILVGAGGFSYEEAADICGVALGTIKSRVARGRTALEEMMESRSLMSRTEGVNGNGDPLGEIMAEVDELASDFRDA